MRPDGFGHAYHALRTSRRLTPDVVALLGGIELDEVIVADAGDEGASLAAVRALVTAAAIIGRPFDRADFYAVLGLVQMT